jgi:hypothetical protein
LTIEPQQSLHHLVSSIPNFSDSGKMFLEISPKKFNNSLVDRLLSVCHGLTPLKTQLTTLFGGKIMFHCGSAQQKQVKNKLINEL